MSMTPLLWLTLYQVSTSALVDMLSEKKNHNSTGK